MSIDNFYSRHIHSELNEYHTEYREGLSTDRTTESIRPVEVSLVGEEGLPQPRLPCGLRGVGKDTTQRAEGFGALRRSDGLQQKLSAAQIGLMSKITGQ